MCMVHFSDIWIQFLIALVASGVAVFLALLIDRMRIPKLRMTVGDTHEKAFFPGRVAWFRVSVENIDFPRGSRWLLRRQTAENCTATVEFYQNNKHLFSMSGLWASAPELAYLTNQEKRLKIIYPNPATIQVNRNQLLNVIVKHEGDSEAYGWNNAAYIFDSRTPAYKLEIGSFLVRAIVFTQNGKTFQKDFELIVGETIETTCLTNLVKKPSKKKES